MEIPELLKAASDAGAINASYLMVRLNGDVGPLFQNWIEKSFPNRAQKILHLIAQCHGGRLNDKRFEVRMKGEGQVAESIRQWFNVSYAKYFKARKSAPLATNLFKRPPKYGQMELF